MSRASARSWLREILSWADFASRFRIGHHHPPVNDRAHFERDSEGEDERRDDGEQPRGAERDGEGLTKPDVGIPREEPGEQHSRAKRDTESADPDNDRIEDQHGQGLDVGEVVHPHEEEERDHGPHREDEGRNQESDTRQNDSRGPRIAGRELQRAVLRKRKALAITVTELRLMAAAAIMGESTSPVSG